MFVALYVLPMSIVTFFYIKVSMEIKDKETGMALSDYDFSPDSNRFGIFRQTSKVASHFGRLRRSTFLDQDQRH